MSVIGEGTYGCIHKPSLKCNTSDVNYNNKVSKILDSTEADDEMREFKVIAKIDENKDFYLGVPHRCSPAKTPENIESIEKCKNGKELVEKLGEYSLLVMEDGGLDLEKYGKMLKLRKPNDENRDKMELFWIEAHRILIGLREFLNHGLVHHDLKPQNIVYNEKSNRLNFIDFGLMDTKNNLLRSAIEDEYPYPIFHWYFPPELPFLEKEEFRKFSKKSEESKNDYFESLLKGNDESRFKIMLKYFYLYIFGSNTPDKNIEEHVLNGIKTTIVDYIKPGNYSVFLKKSINTIDIYGTGISFLYILYNSQDLIESQSFLLLFDLFSEMVNTDLLRRIEINELIEKYEHILEITGILSKHKKIFENNILVDRIEKELPTVDLKEIDVSFKKNEEIVYNDPVPSPTYKKSFATPKSSTLKKSLGKTKICPDGKILNPKTNRCIKTKKTKSKSPKTLKHKEKICPEGKVLNTITNRCIKIKINNHK